MHAASAVWQIELPHVDNIAGAGCIETKQQRVPEPPGDRPKNRLSDTGGDEIERLGGGQDLDALECAEDEQIMIAGDN